MENTNKYCFIYFLKKKIKYDKIMYKSDDTYVKLSYDNLGKLYNFIKKIITFCRKFRRFS